MPSRFQDLYNGVEYRFYGLSGVAADRVPQQDLFAFWMEIGPTFLKPEFQRSDLGERWWPS